MGLGPDGHWDGTHRRGRRQVRGDTPLGDPSWWLGFHSITDSHPSGTNGCRSSRLPARRSHRPAVASGAPQTCTRSRHPPSWRRHRWNAIGRASGCRQAAPPAGPRRSEWMSGWRGVGAGHDGHVAERRARRDPCPLPPRPLRRTSAKRMLATDAVLLAIRGNHPHPPAPGVPTRTGHRRRPGGEPRWWVRGGLPAEVPNPPVHPLDEPVEIAPPCRRQLVARRRGNPSKWAVTVVRRRFIPGQVVVETGADQPGRRPGHGDLRAIGAHTEDAIHTMGALLGAGQRATQGGPRRIGDQPAGQRRPSRCRRNTRGHRRGHG
jgi:hypothetical protein